MIFELNMNCYTALLELVKIGIGTSDGNFDFSVLTEEDWNSVMSEVFSQTMGLMCFEAINKAQFELPKEIYDTWFKRSLALTARGMRNLNAQKKLIKLLVDNNIPYTILKGMSSAFYYPEPDNRASGDIDFIVKPEDLERTRQLLCDNEYKMEPDFNGVHYEFDYENARFELHKKVSGIPEHEVGKYFEEELKNIVEEGVMTEGGFVKPCDYHHGLVIFLHTLHHMLSNGIGARQLCDWACFVNKTKEESFWTEKFIPLLKKTGTFRFASSLTEACIYYLGIEKPDWHAETSSELRDTVITEIYTSGNFGRKNPDNNSRMNLMVVKNSKKLTVFGKMGKMIKALNRSNIKVFPILKKAPYLYPFIMIYRVLRHIVLIIRGQRPSLAKVSRQAEERNKVFVQYNLYETEE